MIAVASERGEAGLPPIPRVTEEDNAMAARKTASGAARGKPASAQLMREALLLSLQREGGKGPKSRQRLQMVADALVDAAIKGEMAAVREVFHRIDGKTAEALSGEERRGPGELRIRWLTAAYEVPGAEPMPGCAKSSRP